MLTDETLATDFQNGNDIAFVTLYNRYKRAVYIFSVKMLGSTDEAKDIVQGVFLKVYERRAQLADTSRFKAWLFTIARNDCLTRLRHTNSNTPLEDDTVDLIGDASVFTNVQDETEIVRTAIGRLQPYYREVIILREYDNLSYQEIAGIVGTTESIVKSRLFTARQQLCKILKPVFYERKET